MTRRNKQATRANRNRQQQIQWGAIAALVIVSTILFFIFTSSNNTANTTPTSQPEQATSVSTVGEIKQWSTAPEMTINSEKQYFAKISLANGGQFVIELYPAKAPITVNSFVFLAREGFLTA